MRNVAGIPSPELGEFKNLLEKFCTLAKAEGVDLTPYTGEGPRFFALLPQAQKTLVLDSFRAYVEVCAEVVAQGASLRDDRIIVWRVLQRLKLHPPSDLMQEIKEGEVIEIYNSDFVQIFRNLRFFEICSYTLDELLSRPLWELVEREESITGMIVHQASKLLSGTINGLFQFDVPEHSIYERESVGRNKITVKLTIGAPLWNALGTPTALINFLHVSSCVRTTDV